MGNDIRRVVVTGGSGKAGRAVVQELKAKGYRVTNLDLVPGPDPSVPFTRVDFTDFGETMNALSGIDTRLGRFDAVVHLAAIPSPGLLTDEATFRINTSSTYNVFAAATRLGAKRIVWASSETVLGLPFVAEPPAYAPLDEAVPRLPNWSYALSKVLAEEMAEQFARWNPDVPFIGLRLSNVMEPQEYETFPAFQNDARLRAWNLWSYVDARDVAQAFRLALEADISGAEAFIIAAADTVMERTNAELMAEIFPDTPLRQGFEGHQSLLSSAKAQDRLGYRPAYSWRPQA